VSHGVSFRAEAFADVAEAFSWYQAQRPGLGDEFEAELGRTLDLLLTMPEAAPAVHRHVRRALVHRFPYALYFTLADEGIEVLAVLHTRRSPAIWHRRAQA